MGLHWLAVNVDSDASAGSFRVFFEEITVETVSLDGSILQTLKTDNIVFVYVSVWISDCLSGCLSDCMPVLSICLSVFLTDCPSSCLEESFRCHHSWDASPSRTACQPGARPDSSFPPFPRVRPRLPRGGNTPFSVWMMRVEAQ